MEWITLLFAFISGALTGLVYFGGLWLTLKQIARYNLSYTLLIVSFVLRLAFVLLVFYVLVIYHWAYLAIALLSFLAVRQILLTRLGKTGEMAIHKTETA